MSPRVRPARGAEEVDVAVPCRRRGLGQIVEGRGHGHSSTPSGPTTGDQHCRAAVNRCWPVPFTDLSFSGAHCGVPRLPILVVVLGHWLIAIIHWDHGVIGSISVIGRAHGLWLATWLFRSSQSSPSSAATRTSSPSTR